MNWHYVRAGQPVGPVSDADLEQLVQSGAIQADTLVWNETMSGWQPYGKTRPPMSAGLPAATPGVITGQGEAGAVAGSSAVPPAADEVLCAECRKPFARSEVVNLGNAWVCATCKPIFVQRMREGAAPGPGGPSYGSLPTDPEEMIKLIRARGYDLDIGKCFSRSWELMKSNFWLVVGGSFLSWLIQQAPGMIPLLGVLVSLVLYGILNGGLYNFFIKLIRGQSGGVADVFSGFGPRWGQLMLVPIMQALLLLLVLAPGAMVFGGVIYFERAGGRHDPSPFLFLLIPVFLVPVVYLGVSWLFSLPLVIDRGLNFGPAMKLSRRVISLHWWTFFAMLMVGGLILLGGVLACVIGVFVAIPVFTGMLMYAYDDIFGSGQALGA